MQIGIIGAGASGMMAAIMAAGSGSEVVLIEKNERVGKKILATGNGKCNVSNLNVDMENYYCTDKKKLSDIFSVFSVWDLLSFFESNGLMIRDKNGYLYPYSEQASVVLDFFRRLLQKEKIKVVLEKEITSVSYQARTKKFAAEGTDCHYEFDKLIVACGGPASQKKGSGMTGFEIAKSFGHKIHKIVPGLVQLRASDSFLKIMAGVRTQAKISLIIDGKMCAEEQGEVQFTDYGISGIPVFQISRVAAYALEEKRRVQVSINLFPDYDELHFWYQMRLRYENMQDASLEEFLIGTVNKKINTAMIKHAGLKGEQRVSSMAFQEIKKLMQHYRELIVHVTSVNGMENAQICAGGVDFSEVSTEMESLKQPGLFFTGEVVDVDGKCGGYNLQWAFTSGYIAGKSAAGNTAKELMKRRKEEPRHA